MELEEVIERATELISWADSYEYLDIPFDIKPEQFLSYAEKNLREGMDDENLINALTNIKRAIGGQIDSLLYIFGYYELASKGRWNFPKKTGLIDNLGVVAPRILKRINKRRNELEHEYKKPKLERVEDDLDVAHLFILYTNRFFNHFPDRIFISEEYGGPGGSIKLTYTGDYLEELTRVKTEEEWMLLEYNKEKHEFVLKYFPPGVLKKPDTFIVKNTDENYSKLMVFLIEAAHD